MRALPDALQARKQPLQSRSRATVDAIREAATQVLLAEGLAGTTTMRVAGRAGVSIGSLYQYYPTAAPCWPGCWRGTWAWSPTRWKPPACAAMAPTCTRWPPPWSRTSSRPSWPMPISRWRCMPSPNCKAARPWSPPDACGCRRRRARCWPRPAMRASMTRRRSPAIPLGALVGPMRDFMEAGAPRARIPWLRTQLTRLATSYLLASRVDA